MRYTLRQLEVFLAIAKHKNTSRAAEALHMSQSAVSAALQALEKNHDVQLFDRQGKRLELNAVGKTLRGSAEALLAHAEEFNRQLLDHNQIGHLKIGASYTIANYHAVTYLADYLDEFPDAEVEFVAGNSPDIVAAVLNYEVDLGMIESEINHKSLLAIPWIDDELVIFCSASHPLAQKKNLTTGDLVNARWILREADSGARQTFDRAFQKQLPKLDIYLEFKHNEAIKRAVESGLGIGCLSEKVLEGNFRDGTLVPLAVPKQHRMQRRFYFIIAKNRHRSLAMERWVEKCGASLPG